MTDPSSRQPRRKPAPEGIRRVHSRSCASRSGADCNCPSAWEASAWSSRDGRRLYKRFPSLADAKAWRSETTTDLRKGKRRARPTPTLREAAAAWLAGARDGTIRNRSGGRYKPSAIRSYEAALRDRLLPELGNRRLANIDRLAVQDLADRWVAEGLSGSTVRNLLMPARVILRRAVERGEVAVSPLAGLRLPAPAPGRDRIASPAEALALVAALHDEADRALWSVAFFAGLRAGELAALTWAHVDFDRGTIRVERAWDAKSHVFVLPKSRKSRRTVPLTAEVRAALLAHRLRSGRRAGLIFGADGARPFSHSAALARASAAWKAAGVPPLACDVERHEREGAELPPFGRMGLHEARHSFVSMMLAAGVPPANVSAAAGHASVGFTLSRYVHARSDEGAADAARLDAHLAGAVGP